eukprot:TRINITY_DN535_c0_g1_i1.p1 TRINITY_DN535_c0_g1~~TRINITY_DN535_c0_g1_i1.p1  ORF type:complete len:473 (+),score=170.90 TRINITY_DN535_c0_g1_i1:95-1513(+)
MPAGPFSARADAPWDKENACTGPCGHDALRESGEAAEGPLKLSDEILSGEVKGLPKVNVVIVGAGLSGAVIAERCATMGKTALVIDKRDHIGGNCYDYLHSETGIRMSRYGAHLFHTKHERVWDYVLRFSEWIPFDHRVRGLVRSKTGDMCLVPIPPTQKTVNTLLGENIRSDKEMEEWYEKVRVGKIDEAKNSQEAALARVGPDLYEAIFKHYTKKQWDKYPEELDASVMKRLPCRTTTDDRYFSCKYQALPHRGYTRIFENMLFTGACKSRVTVRLNCDFFKIRQQLPPHDLLVFTGPIDSFYASQGLPKLEYRSIRFEETVHPAPEQGFFQEAFVVNHPYPEVPYTRIVEYKHLPIQPEAVRKGGLAATVTHTEFSTSEGDPYYPVPNEENRQLYNRYQKLAAEERGVAFVGRLASYKYFNMDEAILNALEMFEELRAGGKLEPAPPPAAPPRAPKEVPDDGAAPPSSQ